MTPRTLRLLFLLISVLILRFVLFPAYTSYVELKEELSELKIRFEEEKEEELIFRKLKDEVSELKAILKNIRRYELTDATGFQNAEHIKEERLCVGNYCFRREELRFSAITDFPSLIFLFLDFGKSEFSVEPLELRVMRRDDGYLNLDCRVRSIYRE